MSWNISLYFPKTDNPAFILNCTSFLICSFSLIYNWHSSRPGVYGLAVHGLFPMIWQGIDPDYVPTHIPIMMLQSWSIKILCPYVNSQQPNKFIKSANHDDMKWERFDFSHRELKASLWQQIIIRRITEVDGSLVTPS